MRFLGEKKEYLEVNRTRFYYELSGSGETITFIHGFSFDTRSWDDQFHHFVKNYQVLRYDMRGFGKSSPPDKKEYSHDEDLKLILDSLDISKTHVIGHSLGGFVAINFALNFPEYTRSLIGVDPALGGYEWSPEIVDWMNKVWTMGKNSDLQEVKEAWRNFPSVKPLINNTRSGEYVKKMINDYSGWDWFNEDPHRVSEKQAIERLSEINISTLITLGELNPKDYYNIVYIMVKNIPNAKKAIIKGTNHYPQMENADQFNKEVENFLN
ncbi:MAG: 2-hydroxy-6-oxo-6-phenylhexa-2,4-dienoate hydrolase [Candidatus Heimdallarchaeota archaeon LC_3]|nr:MAG: 2-hydroxy-6-oxo-6-phenylhexa-2,4-dienoate hydrolase [Candidatus Heimdallarchaeota archaeon LC_3]